MHAHPGALALTPRMPKPPVTAATIHRYGCTQQPWALATLGQQESGIMPGTYSARVRQHLDHVRARTNTAPAALDPQAGPHGTSLEDDVLTVTNDTVVTVRIRVYAGIATVPLTYARARACVCDSVRQRMLVCACIFYCG